MKKRSYNAGNYDNFLGSEKEKSVRFEAIDQSNSVYGVNCTNPPFPSHIERSSKLQFQLFADISFFPQEATIDSKYRRREIISSNTSGIVIVSSKDAWTSNNELYEQVLESSSNYSYNASNLSGYAKAIFQYLGSSFVLDPFIGLGDRMLGADAASVTKYVGFCSDPVLTSISIKLMEHVGHSHVNCLMDSKSQPNSSYIKFDNNYEVYLDDFEISSNKYLTNNYFDCVFINFPYKDTTSLSSTSIQSDSSSSTVDSYELLFQLSCQCLRSHGHVVLHTTIHSERNFDPFFITNIHQICSISLLYYISLLDQRSNLIGKLWIFRKYETNISTRLQERLNVKSNTSNINNILLIQNSDKTILNNNNIEILEILSSTKEQKLSLIQTITNPMVTIRTLSNPTKPHITFHLFDDSICAGGTKQRLLGTLFAEIDQEEVVYAGPAGGMAQVALAYCAKLWGKKAVVFLNGSKESSVSAPFVQFATLLGAHVRHPKGKYQTLRKAQELAENYVRKEPQNRFLCPFGIKYIPGDHVFELFKDLLLKALKSCHFIPERIWLVVGSGFILRILHSIWPNAEFMIVQVGKKVHTHELQDIHYQLFIAPENFHENANVLPPYNTVPWYDAKLWQFFEIYGSHNDCIWNVGGISSCTRMLATRLLYEM